MWSLMGKMWRARTPAPQQDYNLAYNINSYGRLPNALLAGLFRRQRLPLQEASGGCGGFFQRHISP